MKTLTNKQYIKKAAECRAMLKAGEYTPRPKPEAKAGMERPRLIKHTGEVVEGDPVAKKPPVTLRSFLDDVDEMRRKEAEQLRRFRQS